jgi:hypothetical protein
VGEVSKLFPSLDDEKPALDGGLRAGVKTTEFWLSLGSLLVGLGLVAFGQTEIQQLIGGAMLTLTTPGYAISRSITKKGNP